MPVNLVIDGKEIQREEKIPLISPGNGQVLDYVSKGTSDDAKSAVDSAARAFGSWSETPIYKRCNILQKTAALLSERIEDYALTLAKEAGKPIRDSRTEVLRAIGVFTYAAEEARRMMDGGVHRVDAYEYPPGNENRMVFTLREPLGVVSAILPFNFPTNSFAHKVAPALATGNTVVVKPSIQTPLSALKLTHLVGEAGLPPGCLNLVVGQSKDIGDILINHPDVAMITFTGSTEVGLKLAGKAAANAKRMIMELGGSDPFIVFDDADLGKAVSTAVRGRFDYAGQNCNSSKRFIVHQSIAKDFAKKFAELTAKLSVGDPLLETTEVGPVISQDAVETMERFVEDATRNGGKVLTGGSRLDRPGFYFKPTVVSDLTEDADVLREEVFGPVAPIIPFKDVEDAIAKANSVDYGLQSAIHTKDYKSALTLARRLQVGAVIINDSTRLRWDALPFGGKKKTGFGREGVRDTMLEMTEVKVVSLNLAA
ncbi:MAG: aldehyde dehydrogenase family protein [Thaumarchaeota archaeon]|nr:aldehyde dehydrogenase family protein [Nitrososphaerota archaeon]